MVWSLQDGEASFLRTARQSADFRVVASRYLSAQQISPKFKTFAKNYDTLKFFAVDVDALPEVAEKCEIQVSLSSTSLLHLYMLTHFVRAQAMPTFQVWRYVFSETIEFLFAFVLMRLLSTETAKRLAR